MMTSQQMSPQVANPALLCQRFKENHLYLLNQGMNQEGGAFFLFYAKAPKADEERLFAEVAIR